jgi:phospholipid/cholesterol/gamma-HCH transport system substrate-binding protein
MESKSLNFVIGLFVVAGIAAIFIVGLWLTQKGSHEKTVPFQTLFEDSVAGLSVGSKVSYRGIRIGTVTYIGIKSDDPRFVAVRMAIGEAYPIRKGDMASLKLEGITGSSYIDIEGAEWGNEIVESTPEDIATIPSRRSELGQLVKGLPELINEGTVLVQRFGDLLDERNRDQVTSILANIDRLSGTLAEQGEKMDDLLVTANDAGAEIIAVSRSLQQLVTKVDILVESLQVAADGTQQLISKDGTELVVEWKSTARSLRELSHTAQNFLVDNEDALEHFSQEGLYELTLFLIEARHLVAGLTRVVDRIEASGARFLLDQHTPEVDPN